MTNALAGRNFRRRVPPEMLGPTPSEAITEALNQDKARRAGERPGFMAWALKVPEPKAGRMDFERFPFQVELYEEGVDDPDAVIKKSTQVGVSAFGVRWALYHADTKGWTGLYVFPTQRDVWDFSAARIKPVIDRSPYLSSRQQPDDPDNKGMKGIGLGLVYFRGSESKRGLDSVDADHIVFDEYDTLVQENIPDAERRVTGSLHGLIRRVGVPSVPDFGIDALYQQSDQRQWHTKCESCGEWQSIDFFENVDTVKMIRVCRRCTKPLNVAKGEWVPEFPDRDTRGYHITRLIAPLANIKLIVAASKKKKPHERQVFFNKDLGIAYAPEEGRLSKEALAAAQSAGDGYTLVPGYAGSNLVTMGVDVASTRALNVRVSEHLDENRKRALWIGEVDNFNKLDDLMRRFSVKMAAVDTQPEHRLAQGFAERFPGRVYLVGYNTSTDPKDPEVLKLNEELREARVRRVEGMDATSEMIRGQRNLLPLDLPEGYVEQMQAPVRVAEKDELGKIAVYYRSTGADDYFHAEVYDIVATELWWLRQGLEEATRDVYKPLEEMLEFERSGLHEYGEREYGSGGEREYRS